MLTLPLWGLMWPVEGMSRAALGFMEEERKGVFVDKIKKALRRTLVFMCPMNLWLALMKHIAIEDYEIVHSGQTWQYDEKPCQKSMLGFLEKNEAVVTWLKPKKPSCPVEEQIPCIRVKVFPLSFHLSFHLLFHLSFYPSFISCWCTGQVLLHLFEDDEGHLEACEACQGLCQHGCSQGWEQKAPDPNGLVPRKAEDPAQIQCKCPHAMPCLFSWHSFFHLTEHAEPQGGGQCSKQ